ncbi:short chain dehydrogenase (plasmid) [Nocardioides sp. R1-1]|uniref:short chain dehydrogenase n=1 Tax=Nocardioides sp. R1-1 TaxID=3383502 RepID=UPI0038D1766D
MRILAIGASGTIGSVVAARLTGRGHEVITASRNGSMFSVDIAEPRSVQDLYTNVGEIDAVVCTAGSTPFGRWQELGRPEWRTGLDNKLLGQVEVVLAGRRCVREGGSFTLTTGVLSREPVPTGSIASAVNGALESWVRATALELWGSVRVNCVSPRLLRESSAAYGTVFAGHPTVPAETVADAFVRSVEGMESGRVFEP